MTPHGHFDWNELVTRDAERAKRFYQDLIGWQYEAHPMAGGGTYWVATMDGTPVGGVYEVSGPEFESMPDNWMPYLAVDDVDAGIVAEILGERLGGVETGRPRTDDREMPHYLL